MCITYIYHTNDLYAQFLPLEFWNKRDIGDLLWILLVFVLSGQQFVLICANIDNRSWRQWQHFVTIVRKVDIFKSYDCDIHITV